MEIILVGAVAGLLFAIVLAKVIWEITSRAVDGLIEGLKELFPGLRGDPSDTDDQELPKTEN